MSRALALSLVLLAGMPGEARGAAAEAGPPAARHRRRIDVHLRNAELSSALLLLADAAGLALVADGSLHGSVTLDLRDVDPYDAIVVIVASKNAEMHLEGAVLVVRAR